MRSFILRENVRRLSAVACADLSLSERRHIEREIIAMKRELAVLDAANMGAQRYPMEFGRPSRQLIPRFQMMIDQETEPTMIVDPRPGLHLVDVNAPHAAATFQDRLRVAGQRLFDVFPDNPVLETASGPTNLLESIRSACVLRQIVRSTPQRYDVQDTSGVFVPRYWQTVSVPIFDDEGSLLFVLHKAKDVTADHYVADAEGVAEARST